MVEWSIGAGELTICDRAANLSGHKVYLALNPQREIGAAVLFHFGLRHE